MTGRILTALRGLLALALLLALCGCARSAEPPLPPEPEETAEPRALSWDTMEYDHSLELLYAEQLGLDYYAGGYQKIAIGDGGRYLVVPEGADLPSGIPEGVTVLRQPRKSIYLVATSAMDLFRQLDAMGSFSGIYWDSVAVMAAVVGTSMALAFLLSSPIGA